MISYFLHAIGLRGECVETAHVGWIELQAFNWQVMRTDSGPVSFADFSFMKHMDRTSPDLALACAEGRVFDRIVIDATNKENGHVIMSYEMANCMITSLSPGGHGGYESLPLEQVTFSYKHIEWKYVPLRDDGTSSEAVTRSFTLSADPRPAGGRGLDVPPTSSYVPNTAFIVMWMDPDRPELEDVHLTIKAVCSEFGIKARRADDIQHDDRITEVILEQIRLSEFIIADVTGERPNVYYEIGHAHAIGKRPILIRRKGIPLHFDLAVHNAREYRNVTELREILTSRFRVLAR